MIGAVEHARKGFTEMTLVTLVVGLFLVIATVVSPYRRDTNPFYSLRRVDCGVEGSFYVTEDTMVAKCAEAEAACPEDSRMDYDPDYFMLLFDRGFDLKVALASALWIVGMLAASTACVLNNESVGAVTVVNFAYFLVITALAIPYRKETFGIKQGCVTASRNQHLGILDMDMQIATLFVDFALYFGIVSCVFALFMHKACFNPTCLSMASDKSRCPITKTLELGCVIMAGTFFIVCALYMLLSPPDNQFACMAKDRLFLLWAVLFVAVGSVRFWFGLGCLYETKHGAKAEVAVESIAVVGEKQEKLLPSASTTNN